MAAASLGSATGSRVDSAARHTMPCKVNSKYFLGTIENIEDGENMLHQQRVKYAMEKDEITMNTSKKFHAASGHTAYPLVITTLGDVNVSITDYLKSIYQSVSATEFLQRSSKEYKDEWARNIPPERAQDRKVFDVVAAAMPEFRCQGVALGQAFASHLTGDTVATVLVGGMMTVMNGHFEMFAGTCRARPAPAAHTSASPAQATTYSGTSISKRTSFTRIRTTTAAREKGRRPRTRIACASARRCASTNTA